MAIKLSFEEVYEVVKLIPPGRVATYGDIAAYLGTRSSRYVGWALNHSHLDISVPAHRVVNRLGILSGRHHFEDPNEMAARLEAEGIEVLNGEKVKEFERLRWQFHS